MPVEKVNIKDLTDERLKSIAFDESEIINEYKTQMAPHVNNVTLIRAELQRRAQAIAE